MEDSILVAFIEVLVLPLSLTHLFLDEDRIVGFLICVHKENCKGPSVIWEHIALSIIFSGFLQ